MERIRENGCAYYMENFRVITRKFSVYSLLCVNKIMETVQELSNSLEGLVSSIGEAEKQNKDFLTHKYLLISTHVNSELKEIESKNITNREKLKTLKLLNIYKAIEKELEKKAHESTSKELYNKIIGVLELVKNANT